MAAILSLSESTGIGMRRQVQAATECVTGPSDAARDDDYDDVSLARGVEDDAEGANFSRHRCLPRCGIVPVAGLQDD